MDTASRFYNHFLDSSAVLHDQINALGSISEIGGERQTAIDHILAGINKLQNETADAADHTPSYDRKQFAESIKSLQTQLNEAVAKIATKPRFQFKRTAKATHVDMGAPENDPRLHPGSFARNLTGGLDNPSVKPKKAAGEDGDAEDAVSELPESTAQGKNYNAEMSRPRESHIRKPSFSAARNIGITGQTGLHIILPSSAARATAAGSVTDVRDCVVDMSVPTAGGTPFPGLAIKNVDRSIIVAGRVKGPAHITGVRDSIIVVTAQQVRIHECKNVDMYLHCGSHPIIEDCSGMRFAPLPASYETEADKGMDNQWDQVDDFKWLKAGHSPNWTVLSEGERLPEEAWKVAVPGQPGVSVVETLRKIGLPRK